MVSDDMKGASGKTHFTHHILKPFNEADICFKKLKDNGDSTPDNEQLQMLDESFISDLTEKFERLKSFVQNMKLYLSNIRLQGSEPYKQADVDDLKWFRIEINDLKWFRTEKDDINLKWLVIKFRKEVPNLEILLNFKLCITLCTLALLIPFILILWKTDHSTVIELSSNILKLVAPGTLGMLGLVVTSATFIANFYKDKLQRFEFSEKRNKLIKTIKTKKPEDIFILTDYFVYKNDRIILDSLNARNISKNLHKLSLYLILFVISSLLFYMVTFTPSSFNLNMTLYFLFLTFSILLFVNILFTVLFIIRIITMKLLFNDLPLKKYD